MGTEGLIGANAPASWSRLYWRYDYGRLLVLALFSRVTGLWEHQSLFPYAFNNLD